MSSNVTRRQFLGTTGQAAAGLAAATTLGQMARKSKAAPASEKFTVALIGCGGMGRYKLNNFIDTGQCNVAAVCDVDRSMADMAANMVQEKLSTQPRIFKDYRDVLDMQEVDVVIIGTPDHWHAHPMIDACKAGKDVYVEKPCCHNIHEAQVMVAAARKYNRVVQVGTHQRSSKHINQAREFVQAGRLGKISMTNTFTYGNEYPDGMGNAPNEPVPEGVDYDMWLGPAPKQPFNRRRFHSSWRWYYDYGCGMVGDWNVHLQDIIMWTMGVTAPIAVSSAGGHLLIQDDRTTPDTMQTVYEFGPTELAPNGFVQTYTLRKASGKPWSAGGYGMDFHGTNGYCHVTRGGWQVDADKQNWDDPTSLPRIPSFYISGQDSHIEHVYDFIEAFRSRGTPIASIDLHYHTVVACHLANVSVRSGRKVFWNPEKALCYQDREFTTLDKEANIYLTREYRQGYELPEV